MRPLAAVVCALAIGFAAGPGVSQTMRHQPRTLAAAARYTANHGGVLSTRYGAATRYMKTLSRQLVVRRFRGRSLSRWLCIVERESAFNPGAVNTSSGAAGLFQFLGHPQFSTWRILHDPAYAVDAAWSLSHHGTDFSPWLGGSYSC